MNDALVKSKIPVTIITGFLGSGKTTLLNNIIKKYSNKEFAIFENEFGEIGIDGGLIVGANDNIFELANGCICCSLNSSFLETIIQLLERPRDFNHILIETTGIADPDSIIKAFISSDDMLKRFRIDSVICVADAINLESCMNEMAEVRKQLALSDIILLNKTENASSNYAQALTKFLLEINPMATVFPVSYANINDVNLLDCFAYSPKEIEKSTLSFKNLSVQKPSNADLSSLLLKNSTRELKHEIISVGLSVPGSFDYEKFEFWFRNFLFYNSRNLFRVKGILSFNEMPEKYICHAVKTDYLIEPGLLWDSESRFNKLVFIGKKLNRDKIEDSLYQLLIK